MPGANTTIKLQIMQTPGGGTPPSWRTAKDPNGNDTLYSYQYSGGNAVDVDGQATFNFAPGSGAKTVEIDLHPSSSDWTIAAVTIKFDKNADGSQPPADVSASPPTADIPHWTINDTDVDAESGEFLIIAHHDVTGGGDVVCDPKWKNN